MKQKKLMVLGGIRYVIPVIEAAHEVGVHVITVACLLDGIAYMYIGKGV